MTRRRLNTWSSFALEALVVLVSAVVLVPFYLILVGSLKESGAAIQLSLSLPEQFMWRNYVNVFVEGSVARAYMNSIIISASSTALLIATTAPAAFVLQRRRGRLSAILNTVALMGLIVPTFIVPMYRLMFALDLTGQYSAVILAHAVGLSPLAILLFRSYQASISRDFDEAAIMDGCGQLRLFFQVVFPLMKPVTVTVLIFSCIVTWNDLLYVLFFLSGGDKVTIPLTVYFFSGRYVSSWNYIFAIIVLTVLPLAILYFFAQKHIIAGMTAGAIKG